MEYGSPKQEFSSVAEYADVSPLDSEPIVHECFICRAKLGSEFSSGLSKAKALIQLLRCNNGSESGNVQEELAKSCFCFECGHLLNHINNLLQELDNLKISITRQIQKTCENEEMGADKSLSEREKKDRRLRRIILKDIHEDSVGDSPSNDRTDKLKNIITRRTPYVKLIRLKEEPVLSSSLLDSSDEHDSMLFESRDFATDFTPDVKLTYVSSPDSSPDSKDHKVVNKKKTFFACKICKSKFPTKIAFKHHMQKIHKDSKHTFKCNLCEVTHSSISSLRQHLKSIHGFRCELCEFSSQHQAVLNRHLKLVHGKIKDFECSLCEARFTTNIKLYCHVELKHNTYTCKICESSFRKKPIFIRHMRTIHEDPNYTFRCESCEKIFSSPTILRKHLKKYHGEEQQLRFQCDLCEFSSELQSVLYRHLKLIHGQIKDFECTMCDARFVTNVQLKYHLRVKHKTLTCSYCSVSFTEIEKLNTHKLKFHPENLKFPCTLCQFKTHAPTVLRKHIKDVHEKKEDPKRNGCEEKLFSDFQHQTPKVTKHIQKRTDGFSASLRNARKCKQCGEVFQTWKYFSEHMMSIHGEKMQFQCDKCDLVYPTAKILETHTKVVHLKIKEHMCSSCGNQFGSSGDLNAHFKRMHADEPRIKNYLCDICDKRFDSRSKLNSHRTCTHGGEESKVTCELCGFRTNYITNLRKHIKAIHEQIREYTCHICEKKFSQAANMKRHILSHDDAVPKKFNCNFCCKSFPAKATLKTHEEAIHIRDPKYVCDVCGKGFRAQNYLNTHLRAIHKRVLKQNYKKEVNMEQLIDATNQSQTQTQDGSITPADTDVITLTEIELK